MLMWEAYFLMSATTEIQPWMAWVNQVYIECKWTICRQNTINPAQIHQKV